MKFSLNNIFLTLLIIFAVNTYLCAMDLSEPAPTFRMPEPGTPEWQRIHDSLHGRDVSQTLVVQSSVTKPIDFNQAQTHEELKGIADSVGGFSNFSEQNKAAYRMRRDALKNKGTPEQQLARDAAATAAEKRAKANLSNSMRKLPDLASQIPNATPLKKDLEAMSLDELKAYASSFGDKGVPDGVRRALLARRNQLMRKELPATGLSGGENHAADALYSKASNNPTHTAMPKEDPATIQCIDDYRLPDAPKKPSAPSHFDAAVKYMRDHKLKTAAITTGLVLGIDLAYAYRTKVTAQEKQNNRLHKNLLRAAGRTKTAAVLSKLKDVVQSRWARKA